MDWGVVGAVVGIACIVVLGFVAWRAVVDRDDARERLAESLLEQVRWKTSAVRWEELCARWRKLCVVTAGLECCGAPNECAVCRRVDELEQAECDTRG